VFQRIPSSARGLAQRRRARCAIRRVVTLGLEAVAVVSLALLFGCASNPGVAPLGNDTYIVTRQAATGFSGLASLKADALSEADAYCASQHKTMVVISTSESQPPYIFGNFPRSEVQFRCVLPSPAQ
jgi:hypothetical protein